MELSGESLAASPAALGGWGIEKLCCPREKAEEEESISWANKWTQPNQADCKRKRDAVKEAEGNTKPCR